MASQTSQITPLRVDIISDVMCPWCLIGWLKFQKVIAHYQGVIDFDIRWRAFELNPDMPADGVNAAEFLAQRYGLTPEQSSGNRQRLNDAAAEMGFAINWGGDFRMRNTLNAHRLLAWAEAVDDQDQPVRGVRQIALKEALFRAHFAEQKDVNNEDILVEAAVAAGLDGDKARRILASDDYADVVRAEEEQWRENGINGVPAFILNGSMLISGAQEAESFIRVIDRKILAKGAEI